MYHNTKNNIPSKKGNSRNTMPWCKKQEEAPLVGQQSRQCLALIADLQKKVHLKKSMTFQAKKKQCKRHKQEDRPRRTHWSGVGLGNVKPNLHQQKEKNKRRYHPIKEKHSKQKIPSEIEVAPRYTLLTLLTRLILYYSNCFTLLK